MINDDRGSLSRVSEACVMMVRICHLHEAFGIKQPWLILNTPMSAISSFQILCYQERLFFFVQMDDHSIGGF